MARYRAVVPTTARNGSVNHEGLFSFEAATDGEALSYCRGPGRSRFRSGGVDWFRGAVVYSVGPDGTNAGPELNVS